MRQTRSWACLVMGALAFGGAGWPGAASAQSPRGAARTSPMAGAPGPFANPYMNPYTNPFLNPYATQYPMTGTDAALSFLAAQQATGGLGSGRLSGVRPAAVADVPRRPNTTAVPGAGASRYFNRGLPAPGGTRGHYSRPGSYYQDFRH